MSLAKLSFILQLLLLMRAYGRQPAPHPPPAPTLRFLYHLNSTLGEPVSFGPGPSGTKLSIPILGGTVEGPHISGNSSDIEFRVLVVKHTDDHCIRRNYERRGRLGDHRRERHL
jgi:hypothetical protein